MRVLAIMGSPRIGDTHRVTQRLEEELKSLGEVEFEYLLLKDANLEMCRGCFTCLARGEELCPIKDDRADIEQRMLAADGVVFVSPTYVMNVTALMKNFIDRFAYVCHRPRFFGKHAVLISTAGGIGTKQTLNALEMPAWSWGFNVVGRLGFHMFPHDPTEKIRRQTAAAAAAFYRAMETRKPRSPRLMDLMAFRFQQHAFSEPAEYGDCDYEYWKQKGWLDRSAYYYCEARASVFKRALASLIARIIVRLWW